MCVARDRMTVSGWMCLLAIVLHHNSELQGECVMYLGSLLVYHGHMCVCVCVYQW